MERVGRLVGLRSSNEEFMEARGFSSGRINLRGFLRLRAMEPMVRAARGRRARQDGGIAHLVGTIRFARREHSEWH